MMATDTEERSWQRLVPAVMRAMPPAFAALALGTTARAADEDNSQLETVTIIGQRDPAPILATPDSAATEYRIGGEGIDLYGGPGGTNPFSIISHLPSVNAPGLDPYGMANVPGGVKGLRVRGEISAHGSIGTIDGLPLTGISPGPGYQWLFDMENFSSVSLAQGPIAPDRLSFFTTTGLLDSELLWPQAKPRLSVSQALGSFDFRRTFLRADSGELGAWNTALFVSGSTTHADKWRGSGDSPDGRNNIEAGLRTHPTGQLEIGLYGAWNDMDGQNYRALTYAQARDLKTYRKFDFADTSSATPATAINYQGYNQQGFHDWALFSEVKYTWNDDLKLVVKPYYTKETGYYLDGMSNGRVRRWLLDHDFIGATAELQARAAGTDFTLGYWWNQMEPPGPPTAWKMYMPAADGSMTFAMWPILAKVTDKHEFNSPYLLVGHDFDRLRVEGGLRYVRQTLAGIQEHNATGVGDLSYSAALAAASGVIDFRSVTPATSDEVLPFLSLRYRLNELTTLKLSAGRNFGAQSIDIWPVYQMSAAAFSAAGYTADELWHGMRPETADAVDLGLTFGSGENFIAPTVFYSKNHHKSVSYDPGIGIAYSQNTATTRAYGAQLAGAWQLPAQFSTFFSASWNRNKFDADLPMVTGAPLAVDGLQLPDTPERLASAGLEWKHQRFESTLTGQYSSSRFGDTLHTQRIGGFVTWNLDLHYQQPLTLGRLDLMLGLDNVLDKRYIGFINASYYQLLSNASAIYYPGAPRTVSGKVAFSF